VSSFTILAVLIGLGIVAYFIGRMRSIQVCGGEQYTLHSRPSYHGYYLAILTVLPAAILLVAWGVAERPVTRYIAMQELGPRVLQGTDAEKALTMSVVDTIAEGLPKLTPEEYEVVRKARYGFVTPSDARDVLGRHGVVLGSDPDRGVLAAADELASARATSRFALPIVCFGLAAIGFAWGFTRIRPELRSRNIVEGVVRGGLFVASTVAVLTTIGIVLSVLFETIHFFQFVSPFDFLFGTVWDPRFATVGKAEGQFGLLPLLWGTLFISAVALLVAVPVGLFAAIYMSEYAGSKVRAFAKPVLEILAGIPTIVYGFFALSVFGPLLRDLGFNIGLDISASSVLTAGIVMGVMIIPFVSSLSDDIINAVPQSLREGSYGLGATQSETIKKVILPAALPGIVGAVLLAASRAIGETMIVVLAAGIAANLTLNPLEPVTTITVKIVSQLTGDLEFNSPQTLVAFALGLTLFIITLALNVYALYIVRKYREQYE
jgi:phosphate transport system permease protein